MADERGSLLQRHLLLVQALCDSRTSKGDCQVLAVIASHADKEGVAWPSVVRIAKMACVHRTSVPRSVERLERLGYLQAERQLGKSNVYRLAATSSIDAASTGSAGAASEPPTPAAPMHVTSSAHASQLAAPELPDQQHPCCPNSALELDSPNSEKRTQLPAALSFDEGVEQKPTAEQLEQKRLAEEERKAKERESIRAEYLETRLSHPAHAQMLENLFRPYIADLIEAADSGKSPA